MTKFTSLYSGSDKNSSVIQYKNTNILVDCGGTLKQIRERLGAVNLSLEDIDALILTHPHSDHIKALPMILKYTRIPVYASLGTHEEIFNMNIDMQKSRRVIIAADTEFYIKDIAVNPFPIPHDTKEPLGFNFQSGSKAMTYLTDVGHIPPHFEQAVKAKEFIFLESNHDIEMLLNSARPVSLKKRILGKKGHLSNKLSSEFSNYLIKKRGLERLMLAHLSGEANTVEKAAEQTENFLRENGIDPKKDIEFYIAERGIMSKTVVF